MSSRISVTKQHYGGGRVSIPVVNNPALLNRKQRRAQARALKKTNQSKGN